MLDAVSDLILRGALSLKYDTHTLFGYKDAIAAAQQGYTDAKQIFVFS